MMKKSFIFFSFILVLLNLLPAEQKLFSLSAGISSGYVHIENPEARERDASINTPLPFLIGSRFELNLNPTKQVTFFAGADLFFSFKSKDQLYSNHMFLNIPFGVKIYPDLKGLCFGAAYSPGFRKDYYNYDSANRYERKDSWGNGFKFLVEYNFAHDGKSQYYPTLGISWLHTPSSNYCNDNQIIGYMTFNF